MANNPNINYLPLTTFDRRITAASSSLTFAARGAQNVSKKRALPKSSFPNLSHPTPAMATG